VLPHNALPVGRVHVRHLDTARAVATCTVGTTHKELSSLLGLEKALSTGGVEFGRDVVWHLL